MSGVVVEIVTICRVEMFMRALKAYIYIYIYIYILTDPDKLNTSAIQIISLDRKMDKSI